MKTMSTQFKPGFAAALLSIACLVSMPIFAANDEAEARDPLSEAEKEELRAAREAKLASIERSREEVRRMAEEARQEAELLRQEAQQLRVESAAMARGSEEERRVAREEIAREREELSRTHRELRRATQEVARAHRELGLAEDRRILTRTINLGDRAMMGVILGEMTDAGIKVIGLSPDGPAERAGIKTGDILTSVRGESLTSAGEGSARDVIYEVLSDIGEGEEISVGVMREGKPMDFMVKPEKREPASWASYIRLPDPIVAPSAPADPAAPVAPVAPNVLVERIAVPPVDTAVIAAEAIAMAEDMEAFHIVIEGDDGDTSEYSYSFNFDPSDFDFDPSDFEFDPDAFSEIGSQALNEASLWFGSGATMGLRFSDINEGLSGYFGTDSGILVLEAPEDNAFSLRAGDVVLKVGDHDIRGAADFVRALRDHDGGESVELHIKRDKRDVSLNVVIPENRFGFMEEHLASDLQHTLARKFITD